MNQIVAQKTQLPAHLQAILGTSPLASISDNVLASATGLSFHTIGITGSRWRLNDPQGQEEVVQQLHLNVLIVGANPHKSKIFYTGKYVPGSTEFKAPDCWSDNGIAPSVSAKAPQSKSCAECPHNVWGSKITEGGAQTKACTDAIKLGIILADNPSGPVYQLRVPAASIKNLQEYAQSLGNRGIPLPGVVTRLSFDPAATHPKILFVPQGWASEAQVAAAVEVAGTDEVTTVTGTQDKPRDPNMPLPAMNRAIPSAAPPLPVAPLPSAQPAFQEGVFAPNGDTPSPAKRTRRTKAEIAAAAPQPISAAQPTQAAEFFGKVANAATDIPGTVAPAAAVKVMPQPTTSALDDLINSALKV